jgi:hypothetical protein
MTACQSAGPTPTTGSRIACSVFKELGYSSTKDTKETVTAVRGHNADYRALCAEQKRNA